MDRSGRQCAGSVRLLMWSYTPEANAEGSTSDERRPPGPLTERLHLDRRTPSCLCFVGRWMLAVGTEDGWLYMLAVRGRNVAIKDDTRLEILTRVNICGDIPQAVPFLPSTTDIRIKGNIWKVERVNDRWNPGKQRLLVGSALSWADGAAQFAIEVEVEPMGGSGFEPEAEAALEGTGSGDLQGRDATGCVMEKRHVQMLCYGEVSSMN